MLSTKDAIQLCTTIRASAREAATNRQDCRTLARFVGKIMLILQALEELPCSSLVGNWAEVIGDVKEALWGAAELVETCGNMGRLQAVLQAEEARARFVAVATDLALAVSGLGGVREQAPADVSEDIVSVQRQLEALKFASRAGEERLTWRLMQALTLLYMRAGGAGQAGPLLAQALEQAGLDPGTSSWLDVEVARLKDAIKGAQDEEDWIAEFFYKQVIMCLLARLTGAWDWVRQPSGQGSLWGGSTPAFSSTTASPVKAASPLLGPAAAFTPVGSVGGSGTGSGSSGKSEQEPNGCGMGAGDGERGPSPLPTPLARAGEAALRRGEGAGGSAGSGSGAFPGGPLSSAVPSPLSRDYDKENGNVLADGGAGGQNGGSVVHSRTGSPGLPTAFAQHAQQQLRQGSSTAAVQRLVSAWFGADTAASSSTPSSSGGLGASCGGEGAAQQDTLAEHALALGTAAQPQRAQRPHQGIAVASSGLLGAACSLPSQSSTAVVGAQEDSSSMLCSLDADGVTGTHQAEQQLSPLGNNDLLAAGSGSDSPLSVDTLTALFDAFGVEGCAEMPDTLKTLDPLNLNSVVAALSSPSMLTQFVAMVIIEYHAEERGEEGRAALVGLKVIPALLRALQSSRHPILRGCIASAFRHLARDAATRRRIAEAGAIPLLAQLLTSGSRGTRQAAARALSNLVVNSEANKVEVVKFGAVHSLVRMLESESEFSREASAAALANLAANSEETQAAISAAGAIPSLVSTLRQSSTAAAQQHAARALRNMAGRDNQNKLRAAEAGAIPLLVELMKSSNEASCQAATSALSNIAANCEETQVQIAEAGALTVLLGVLESGSAACREAGAWLLSNLACCSEVRAHIPPERVSPPLVGLLQSAGDSGRQAAARALKALSAGPSNSSKLKIADAGAIPPLVACLSAPSSDATRKAAASALWNLAYRNNSNRRAIAKAGAIPPLVLLLAEAASDGCRQEAARALSNLSCNNEYNQGIEMARHGAIPLLVRMMSSAQAAPGAKEAAVGAVSNLACIKANQAEILESGALPAILALMGAGQTPGCQEAAARAFGNLVCDNMSPQLRTAAGQAVPLLVALVQSGNEGARQAAARALSNLACSDPASQLLVARSGAAQALVLLAQYPNDDLREAAAVALWDLCYDCQAGREAVVRAGGIPWLTELLLFGGDGAKEAAAAAIAELAAVGPAVRQEIEEAGAVPLLRQLAAGDCQEVAMAATEALRSLEANRSGAAGGAAAGARGEGGGGYKRSDSGKGSEGGAGSRGPMSPGRQAAAMRRESMAPLVATMN